MELHAILMFSGMALMILGCAVPGIIQIKKSFSCGVMKSTFAPLSSIELKICIYAGLSFLAGLAMLFIGGFLEINA
jgi:hypothetical protein